MKAKTFKQVIGAAALAVGLEVGMMGCVEEGDENGIIDNGGGNANVDTRWYTGNSLTYTLTSANQLAGLAKLVNEGNSLTGITIVLGNDISLGAYGILNTDFNNGRGWAPIGTYTSASNNRPFGGILDGNGKTITGLHVAGSNQNYVGLFGFVDGGTIKNLGVVGVTVSGREHTGGLAGYSINITIEDCYVTGTVGGANQTGGLVGWLRGGNVERSYSTAAVTGSNGTGGVVGYVDGGGSVSNCYATGRVSGGRDVGGVVGSIGEGWSGGGGTVSRSYAIGRVIGSSRVGGVVGLIFRQESNAMSCVALNSDIEGGQDNGRVVGNSGFSSAASSYFGGVESWERGVENYPMPVNTAGFAGTMSNGFTVSWSNETDRAIGMNGESLTKDDIHTDPTLGGRFTALNGWTTEPGKLPGLFGNTVDMPDHLR
jgi:hypothetical protein